MLYLLAGLIKALHKDKDDLTLQLVDLESTLNQVDDELKDIGAIDPKHFEEAQQKKNALIQREGELLAQLSQVWESAMPTALLGKYRKELPTYLISEEARRDWLGRKRSVEPRIPAVRRHVFETAPEEHALSQPTREYYIQRLIEALAGLFDPPPEGMSPSVFVCDRTEVSIRVRSRLGATLGEVASVAETVTQLDRGRAELRDLNQKLARMTQDDGAQKRGNELREQRGRLIAEQDATSRRLKDVEAEISQLTAKVIEFRGQETEQRKLADKVDRGRTLSLLAHRYREAVGKIKSAAAVQLREQISAVVGELWVDITDRGIEFNGLEFDPKWNCMLRRRNGSLISWELVNTSAGQKQVRLLAFTEALRRLARLAPPLVVDTPLGRLDKEVRQAVLERLYLAGHQSIILTTNAEIDPVSEQFDRIKDSLARVYTLHPEGNPESSDYTVRVSDDYFGQNL